MKIERFIGGAAAGDGGTIACRVVLNDGTFLDLGLDARIRKTKAERLVFIGAGYPTLPGARLLVRNNPEEQENRGRCSRLSRSNLWISAERSAVRSRPFYLDRK